MIRNVALTLLTGLLCCCTQKMAENGHLYPLDPPTLRRPPLRPPLGTRPVEAEPTPRTMPKPLTRRFIERGQERFNIHCAPCHGPAGYGDGIVVQRGFLAPPSYHSERLQKAPDQHFLDVITNGFGAMYSYGDRIDPTDRWAIVSYIRALQLSQRIKTSEERKR